MGRINQVLEGVVDVEVEWKGADLQGLVGEHIVQCKVKRLASSLQEKDVSASFTDEEGRRVVSQCFHVPFSILDTNECTLPEGHAMRHRCDASTLCINTIGSYECQCPRLAKINNDVTAGTTADATYWDRLAAEERSAWEVSFSLASRSSCMSMSSTYGCCPDRVHLKDGATCRAAFRCPTDPCAMASTNTCASSATCKRTPLPTDEPSYTCECPEGLMGNGHKCRSGIDPTPQPKVMYDGVTATEETVKNNYYCGCTKPIVDACSGYPPCKGM